MTVNGKHYRTIWVKENDPSTVQVINQRKLPHAFDIVDLRTVEDFRAAIKDMTIRGAGLIGATAGYGLYVAALTSPKKGFLDFIEAAAKILVATRPTASNLAWAVNRQLAAIRSRPTRAAMIRIAFETAAAIADEDAESCRRIGEHGKALIMEIAKQKQGGTVHILTHCNAGWLAFVDYGSATAPIYAAFDAGVKLHVWVDETRPRNQGASLTAWELGQHGVPHDLIPDNAGGHLMQHGRVDLVLTGTDRVSRNGDVANKIGTYLKAVAAQDNQVPFYVALPSSTFDFELVDGVKNIPIEERDAGEVRFMTGKTADGKIATVQLCPDSTPARNWGFDVTPARLITKLICERGLCEASEEGILSLFPEKNVMHTEGYIKYRAQRVEGAIPDHAGFDALNRCRTELFDLKLLGMYPDGIGYGNVSLRVKESQFIISGSATGGVRTLTKDHYARVESFDLDRNSVRSAGTIDASSESMSHGAIYQALPAVNAVIHIHSRRLFDLMRAERYPETDPAIPYGTPELARAIEALVLSLGATEGIFVTAGHDQGIIAYGESVEEALALVQSVYAKGARE